MLDQVIKLQETFFLVLVWTTTRVCLDDQGLSLVCRIPTISKLIIYKLWGVGINVYKLELQGGF